MKLTHTAILILLATPALAQQETYTIDPQHTFPSFEISHFGYSLQRGRFDTPRHPTITFRASRMTFEGENVKSAEGDLTMAGVTRPVTLRGQMFQCAPSPMTKKKVWKCRMRYLRPSCRPFPSRCTTRAKPNNGRKGLSHGIGHRN